jgi:hypothetical protein
MMFKCYNRLLEVPDSLIKKLTKDFDILPGGHNYAEVVVLRETIYEIMELVKLDPTMLDEAQYKEEVINALAMRQAMKNNGVLYDA